MTGTKYVEVPWTIQGGNLICNGQGTALVTNRVFQDNFITFPTSPIGKNPKVERRKMVVDEMMKFANLKQLVVLEPLQSESTQHVDMFATFLSAGDVLVPIFRSDSDALVGYTVKTIDMTSMKQLQGELHCLSLHIPAFAAVPDEIYLFKNSVRAYFPEIELGSRSRRTLGATVKSQR